jgi:RNA recognition motif-containing protein
MLVLFLEISSTQSQFFPPLKTSQLFQSSVSLFTLLQSIFIDFGPIISAKVVKDKGTKESSLGYGFVKFRTEESARLAIEKRNGFHMGSKTLKVSYARPACDEIRNCKLYVTNLPREYNEKEVMALFSQFGLIIECRVLKNKEDNYGKGVYFLEIETDNGVVNKKLIIN